MIYLVYDANGGLRFQGENWPMARAALDFLISSSEEDFLRLLIFSDKVKKEKAAE